MTFKTYKSWIMVFKQLLKFSQEITFEYDNVNYRGRFPLTNVHVPFDSYERNVSKFSRIFSSSAKIWLKFQFISPQNFENFQFFRPYFYQKSVL